MIAAVWPNTFVDEANLRVHVSALRKALADVNPDAPFIDNIPGRGYSFVAPPCSARPAPPLRKRPHLKVKPCRNLPFATVTPVGRDAFVDGLIQQLGRSRLITVIGAGGMGKTTVAVAAARNVVGDYVDGVAFVDFGIINDGDLVTPQLVSSLEQLHRTSGPLRDPASFLRNRRMLLLFDNCEHLVVPIAELAAHLLRTCPDIRIVATSREPLRVASEWVQRLPPLAFPMEGEGMTAANAASFPAVRLFLDRASEALGGFTLQEADAAIVGDISRRLDGIALAIELAAGRIDGLGLRALAEALDDRFRVLRQGRRTAFPRHQTLRATLDWSFSTLTSSEQIVMRRLAVFSGGFTREAARVVAGDQSSDQFDFEDILLSLGAKSLVAIDVGHDTVRYRLLETTRSYCLEKLRDAGEDAATARSHALCYEAMFVKSAERWERDRPAGWLREYGPEIGNLRVALEWAFSPAGSEDVAVALAISAIPLWFQLSLLDERLAAAVRAVGLLNQQPSPDPRQRMKLNVVLGWPQLNAISGVESGPAAWRTVLEIAEQLGEVDYQVRALWALWVDRTNSAVARPRLHWPNASSGCAPAGVVDSEDVLIGHRMLGRSLHMLGQQPLAPRAHGIHAGEVRPGRPWRRHCSGKEPRSGCCWSPGPRSGPSPTSRSRCSRPSPPRRSSPSRTCDCSRSWRRETPT